MLRSLHLLLSFFLPMFVLLLGGASAHAAARVDLALVLAVDISFSMDPEEQKLQRDGYVEAFRSPEVHAAIANGMYGQIAVTYVEWAATFVQHVVVPWTVIRGSDDALQFAQTLSLAPIHRGPRTSISGAIDFGHRLLDESPVESARRVVDISSDGRNNKGRSVLEARAASVSKGITINGLPVILGGTAEDVADEESYFRDCVIGGPGAFLITVQEQHQFVEAIRLKIIREIAGRSPPEPFVVPAHFRARDNCDFPW